MKLPAFLKHWPVACLVLATGLSGCAGGVSLGRRETAGEVQIESVRGDSAAAPLHLVAGPCGRGCCDGCGPDGCAIIIPRWLAACHEDTAAEVEGGCITRIPWRGVGTCDRPCGPCARFGHGHCPEPDTVEMHEVEVSRVPAQKKAAQKKAPQSKWVDLFVQRRQGVSRPAPVRLPPPAMPTVPLHGGPTHEEREPLVTQNGPSAEPPAEPRRETRARTNETSGLDLAPRATSETTPTILQTKAETKAPAKSEETPETTTPKKTTKPLLPSQIAASNAATRPTVRAAQMPVLKTAPEPPRGENPFETRRPSASANLTQAPPAVKERRPGEMPLAAEQAPRGPAVRSASTPSVGDRSQRAEALPPLRTGAPEKLPPPPARTVVVDIARPTSEAAVPKVEASPVPPAPKAAPQVAEQTETKTEPRAELRPTVRSTADRSAAEKEPETPSSRNVAVSPASATPAAPAVMTPAAPVVATPVASSKEPTKSLVPAFVPNPAPKTEAKPAAPPAQPEPVVSRPAASTEHVVAVGTLHKPELTRPAAQVVAAPATAGSPAPVLQPQAPRRAVVVTPAPAEVVVLPPPQPVVQPAPPAQSPVAPAAAAPAPMVIELPRPGDRFASLEALLLVAEHRYASVRNYRAELVQLRGGSPLPVRESLYFRYRKTPRAIIAGTSADPTQGRQAQWSEGADQWTVVAPVLSGRIKLKLELDEERPLGKDSRPLIECGLAPLLDQLAVHRAAAANGQGTLEYRGPAQRLEFDLPVHEVVYRAPAENWHYYFDAKSYLPVLYEVREGQSLTAYELYDRLEVNVPDLEEPLAFDAEHQFGL